MWEINVYWVIITTHEEIKDSDWKFIQYTICIIETSHYMGLAEMKKEKTKQTTNDYEGE